MFRFRNLARGVLTAAKLAWRARYGVTFADKRLAFLVAAIVSVDPRRKTLYQALLRAVNRHQIKNSLQLCLFCNGKPAAISIRRGNEADYHILGRLVRADYYPVPDFRPKKIIDGGANIGTFSIHAKRYFPEANLVCFEPDADNYRLLESNLRKNKIQAELHQLGLWSVPGTAYFHQDSSRTGFVDDSPSRTPIKVTIPEITKDTWLKLDVEGAEHEILPALLRSGKIPRLITVEVHDFQTRGSGLVNLLRESGYSVSGNLNPDVGCARISALSLG